MKNKRLLGLSLSYLGVIMAISLLFSGIIYGIICINLEQRPPKKPILEVSKIEGMGSDRAEADDDEEDRYEIFYHERTENAKSQTLMTLGLMNVSILILGGYLSFILAKLTLRPIERSFELQEQFISDASHEMRTPLASMMISNEVALRKKVLTEEKSREVLAKNIQEIKDLTGLIDGLLSLTKADKNDVKIEKTSSQDIILGVAEKMMTAADSKGVNLEVSKEDFEVEVNYFAVSQILSIFADNAIKYSPEKSMVELRARRAGKFVIFEVADQGVGVSKEERGKIFGRFYRSDSARTRKEGEKSYGLGLAIAQKIAEQNGFELFVRENTDCGAIFGIKLKG